MGPQRTLGVHGRGTRELNGLWGSPGRDPPSRGQEAEDARAHEPEPTFWDGLLVSCLGSGADCGTGGERAAVHSHDLWGGLQICSRLTPAHPAGGPQLVGLSPDRSAITTESWAGQCLVHPAGGLRAPGLADHEPRARH